MTESEAAYAAREAERETWRAARRELAAALGVDPGAAWPALLHTAKRRSDQAKVFAPTGGRPDIPD